MGKYIMGGGISVLAANRPPSPSRKKTYKLLVPIQAAVIHLYTGVVFMFFVFFDGKGGGGGGGETNKLEDGDLV